jgi:TatD DNase family protein
MIDSHCHLADPQFAQDLEAVLDRAKRAGLSACISIGDSLEESQRCIDLAEKHPQLFATVGIHPHNAKDWKSGDDERILEMVRSSPKVCAIGEVGLDYHYDNSPRMQQRDVFGTQLMIAKQLNLPAVVHCREAVEDVRKILEEVAPQKAVIHCCTENWEDVKPLVEKGYHLSFTGIATYPTAVAIRRTIEQCPLDQLMIETDAPYLAPVPHRGKRNEPMHVLEIAKLVAKIKNIGLAQVDHVTTQTTLAFFGLPAEALPVR